MALFFLMKRLHHAWVGTLEAVSGGASPPMIDII